MRVGIDGSREAGVVVAHEERVVGRDDAVVEDRERRLELRRTGRQDDQRTLLGEGDELAAAVGKRLLELLSEGAASEAERRDGGTRQARGKHAPAGGIVRVHRRGSSSGFH